LRASRAITTITAAAITVKMIVKASPKPKAAPALRIASKRSQSPTISTGSWCSSFATTISLLIRSSAYASAATVKSTAIRRPPLGAAASSGASPGPGSEPLSGPGSGPGPGPASVGPSGATLLSGCSGPAPAAPGVSGVPMMRSASAT
jgi:hypothetical protein